MSSFAAKAANYSHLLESIYCLILKSYINSHRLINEKEGKTNSKGNFLCSYGLLIDEIC